MVSPYEYNSLYIYNVSDKKTCEWQEKKVIIFVYMIQVLVYKPTNTSNESALVTVWYILDQ